MRRQQDTLDNLSRGRFALSMRVWPVALFCLALAGLTILEAQAEEQLTREEYVAQSHEDLLAPCQNSTFVSCLGSSEKQCHNKVNQLIQRCSEQLPGVLNAKNFDESAGNYANCVFGGLQEAFELSSEEIGECENRAGLR